LVREPLTSALGDRQQALAAVAVRGRLDDQLARLEAAQDAAEIARVHSQILGELAGGRLVALRELVEHARLGEGERAFEPAFLQHADALGVEAVEAPHRGDAGLDLGSRHGGHSWGRRYITSSIN
jgi:multidrug efflux pump subunit AcrA (membrane-fusion protein)